MVEAAVVVPFRGNWEQLSPLLKALGSQTVHDKLQTILSVDGPWEPPDHIKGLVDVVVNGPEAGPAAARNRGWRKTEAPLILFTDADCVPEQEWAERMIRGLRGKYQAVKGVYSKGGTSVIQRLAQVEFLERYRILAGRKSVFLADTYSAGFRREWLEKLGGFDETFPFPDHEDVDLSWRMVREGGIIGFLPDARVAHTHRNSWIGYFRLKLSRGKWRIMVIKEFPAMAVSDGYTPQTMKLQMLLVPLVLVSPLLIPFFALYSAVPAVLFLLACIPLLLVAVREDPLLLPLVPVFAFWRGAALLAGAAAGYMGGRRKCLPQ